VQLHPTRTPLDADVNFDDLARRYEVSGGDIRNAVLKAALAAAARPGPNAAKRIQQRDLEAGIESVLAGKQVMRQSLFTDVETAGPEQTLLAEAMQARRLLGYAFILGAVAFVLALIALVAVLVK
jgi:ATP-dependent Zn protease